MLEKLSRALTRKPTLVVIIALLLLIPSIAGIAATHINYDILTYLPSKLDSTKGEKLLEEPFEDAATSMLIVDGMPAGYTDDLVKKIQDVPGVSNAFWISDLTGVQLPTSMLPSDFTSKFYAGDSTMMIIQYSSPGSSDETMDAIDQIRAACNKQCYLAGFSVVVRDTKKLVDKELPLYILLAVVLSLAAMSLTMDSWILPLAFLGSIALAIAYNFGTNIFLGEISYVTKAIAAVLQLGVTMDYSIFLFHRYQEERGNFTDNRDAMARAVQAAFVSLSGSSLTTIAGFVALCFMQLTLGMDIGIVMAKGVMIGVITVIFVLPSILLVLDKPIQKYHHKCFAPNFDKINKFIIRNRVAFFVVFLIIFIPAIYCEKHTQVYYKLDQSLPQDMDSIVANNKMKKDYNMSSTHFIIFKDDLSSTQLNDMEDEINDLKGITSLVSYHSLLGNGVPDFFIPDDVRTIFKQDGMQMIMINSAYPAASDEVSDQISKLRAIVKKYDPSAYITGEAALTDDLIVTANHDFKVTNYISIAAIFLIIMILFKSVTVPTLLVAAIELAILINEGIPYLRGTIIPFISPTIIGCVQLGATVDYAILITSRFREEISNGHERKEAMMIAASASDISIITSSLVLFSATLGVGLVSDIEIISSICMMLARGSLISAIISIFIMPSILTVCEPVISHTSLHWKTNGKRVKKVPAAAAPESK